jgi:hypothetical protein
VPAPFGLSDLLDNALATAALNLATLLLTAYFARPTNGVITVLNVLLPALEMPRSERLIADASLFRTPLVERFAAPFSTPFCGIGRIPYIEDRLLHSGAEREVFITSPE